MSHTSTCPRSGGRCWAPCAWRSGSSSSSPSQSLSFLLSSGQPVYCGDRWRLRADHDSNYATVTVSMHMCADPLQVAAVVGAHAGQSWLLLGLLISLLLGISLLPYPPLLLCSQHINPQWVHTVADRHCDITFCRPTSRLAWRSLSFSARTLCCSALSARRFSCRVRMSVVMETVQKHLHCKNTKSYQVIWVQFLEQIS